jgi:membrane associated rhomboid family serine protease
MAREGTIVALPPFYGVTRRILLTAIAVYVAQFVLGIVSAGTRNILIDRLVLHPADAFPQLWQFFTYPFIDVGLLSLLFAGFSFWFFGAALESDRGSRWLSEYFWITTVGGGILAVLLSRFALASVPGFGTAPFGFSLWPAVMAMLLAYARFYPEQELRFNFLFRVRAKHLAAIYLLVYLVFALLGGDRFGALLVVCSALSGYAFLRVAPRRGMRFAAAEQLYGLRNAWYRRKRKQAAKKFTVYMKKQGRDVNLDSSGRYVPLDDERRDPDDKRWMN